MKIPEYSQMIRHMTRDKTTDVPGSMAHGLRNMKLAQVPRSEMDNFNTPDLDQGSDSYLRPGETLEDFDVEFRRPNAQGGMQQLVQPNADGSRPGYSGTKVEDNIRLRNNGNAYDVEIQRGPQTFRKSFNLKDYKNKTEALNAAKKFKSEKIKIPFKTGIQDPMFGSGLDKKEYQKLYHAKTRTLTDAGKLAKERDLKLKNFIGNKKKINASTLRDFVIDDLGYDDYAGYKIKQKFPDLEIVKDIKTGTKFTPLNKKQIELVKENFDLPEGVKNWNFKQYKNGISAAKHPNLFAQIKRRLNNKNVYKVAANFSDPQGWMISAMNRLYENETTLLEDGTRVLKKGVDKLTYEPKFNKKGIIVGFKDNTAAGKNNIYYGTKKAAKNYGDGTDWRVHGDFDRVDKFLNIANGVRSEPDQILQKILNKKGLNIKGLTLNDVLSHQKYYDVLADTSPKALLKRQIVLHHTKGVGDQNVARAAATKDIQLLTDAVNSKVMKLENIVKGTPKNPARKLTNAEKLKLKDYGAKILDFDGKTVGGGFIDPDRQFAAIKKKALEYAKSDKFNVKTVARYLEKLGCGRAAGGRILFSKGTLGASLTECGEKGVTKFIDDLKKGNYSKASLNILKSGGNLIKNITNPMELLKLKNLIGPGAMGLMAAWEGGVITDDVIRQGTPLNESLANNWLTRSFLPYTKQYAEAKNLLETGKVPSNMKKYVQDVVTFNESLKDMQGIQGNVDSRLVDDSFGMIDGSSMYSKEKEDKDVNNLIKKMSTISEDVITPGTGKALEMKASLNEMKAARMAKPKIMGKGSYLDDTGMEQFSEGFQYSDGFSPIFGFGKLKDVRTKSPTGIQDYMLDETPKDLRPITEKDYERTELPAAERQYYENKYNIRPRSSLSEYYLPGAKVNVLDELTSKYNMREAAKYPGFFSADSEKFSEGGITGLRSKYEYKK